MATREELLRAQAEIERKLKTLDAKEYSEKIVILYNPDLNEGRIPFQNRKEFYIKGSNRNVENLKKIVEHIYSKKYGLYNGVMDNSFVLMETFKVLVVGVDSEDKNDLPVFNISNLNRKFPEAVKEISNFLETVPSK